MSRTKFLLEPNPLTTEFTESMALIQEPVNLLKLPKSCQIRLRLSLQSLLLPRQWCLLRQSQFSFNRD